MGFHDDYPFEVQLGRIRSASGTVKSKRFFKTVRKGVSRLRTANRQASNRSRNQARSHFQRRAVVKARVIRMDANGAAAQRLHLRYIERDGTGPNGEPGELYDRDGNNVDKDAFLERGEGDRHQFRFIVSPEDAHELSDLTEYTRDLVTQMEHDLGTKLDWVAVNHYDTGQPHTHLVVRGKREDGKDLVIPKDYISHGLRKRAQELAELELGPVTEIEGRNRLEKMVTQERFNELDRNLFRKRENGIIDLSDAPQNKNGWRAQIERARLNHLADMGLVEPAGKGQWEVRPEAEKTLKRMGERGDIIKAMHRALNGNEDLRMMDASSIYDATSKDAVPVTGKIIDRGIADDVNDRAYIVVDGLNGKPVYAEVGGEQELINYKREQIVTLKPTDLSPRNSDKTIAQIAQNHEGRYSTALHMEADKSARPEYVQAHIRRLEALRRAGHVERFSDGTWQIPKDYLDRVSDFEKTKALKRPPDIIRHTHLTLNQMKSAHGATWLDTHLRDFEDAPEGFGFAKELDVARNVRRNFLVKQGYLKSRQNRLTDAHIKALRTRDLKDAADGLTKELGKAYRPAPEKGRVSGVYTRTIDRASGRFAVIEKSKEFSLVPWREVMDRNIGKSISGVVRGNQISWSLTKGRTVS